MKLSRNHLIFVLGVAALFAISVWATRALFTTENVGANDFYPRWIGAQVYWQEGIDPYSQTATERIQRDMYNGRLARPDEDQVLFVYPFYTIFLLLPLTWLPLDYTWIQAIWLVTLQFSFIGAIFLLLRLVEWPPLPLWLLTGMLLWAVVFYHNARNIILGQFAALVFLCLVVSASSTPARISRSRCRANRQPTRHRNTSAANWPRIMLRALW